MDQNRDCECSICLQIMYEPISLEICQHNFCKGCLNNLIDFSADQFKCPLCRAVHQKANFSVNLPLWSYIRAKYTQQVKDRQLQIELELIEQKSKLKILVIYGNRHQKIAKVGSNEHNWTAFVSVKVAQSSQQELLPNVNDLIQKVTFKLHPTFRENTIILNKAPFQISRIGWGTFNIPIIIEFTKNSKLPPLELEHYLVFADEGEKKSIPITIDLNEIQQIQQG